MSVERACSLSVALRDVLISARMAGESTKSEWRELPQSHYDMQYKRPEKEYVVTESRDILLGRALALAGQLVTELEE